ncbi:MAG: hypothetical protein IKM20_09250 [Erysipelotrichales bacterium]|nr:hypothetical protein [Erysipelotrichales bacterium]
MRKLMMVFISLLLIGCSVQQNNNENVTTNTTSSRPQVYTATPHTTPAPVINIVTTPLTATSEIEETTTLVTTVPFTIKVTTYPVTTTTTTTTTVATTTESTTTSAITTTDVSNTDVTTTVSTTTTPVTTTIPYIDTVTTTTTTYAYTPMYDKVTDVGYDAILEINKLRKVNNLEEYIVEEYLCIAANLRAREIAERFSHVRLDYTNFSTVLDEYGFTYDSAAESIGAGYSNAYSMVYAWAHTANDNKNIMDKKYGFNKVGVGYYYYAGKSYWVMLVIEDGNS